MPDWFTLEELAERWKVHSDIVYRYVESGQLRVVSRGLDQSSFPSKPVWIEKNPDSYAPCLVFVLKEELERFESECMRTASQSTGTPPYLDPDNPHYAPELAAAVNAWMRIYKQGKLPPGRVPTEDIRTWLNVHLKEYVPDPSKGMMDRIVTVVNPAANKAGGAIPTEKN